LLFNFVLEYAIRGRSKETKTNYKWNADRVNLLAENIIS
jgi:hypothetical protein